MPTFQFRCLVPRSRRHLPKLDGAVSERRIARRILAILWLVPFLFTPPAFAQGEPLFTSIVSEGPGWQVIRLETLDRSLGIDPVTEVYVISGVKGIRASPLPEGEKERLLELSLDDGAEAEADEPSSGAEEERYVDRVFFIHKEIVDSYWATGTVPDRFLQDPLGTCSSEEPGEFVQTHPATIPIQGSMTVPENPSGGVVTSSAEVSWETDLELQLGARVNYRVLRNVLCIPYLVLWDRFALEGDIGLPSATVTVDLRAEAEWSQTYQKNIANPTVWRAFFVAGYLPVYITFQLPTHIGLEVGTTAVAQTELELGFGGTFSFDFRCNPGGCTGGQSQDFRFHNLDSIPDVATGSVEVDVNAKPFLDSRLQVNLYHERVFHLEAGLRAGIQNRLWGYAGTQCGDADGDGQNELVHGALLDIYGDLDVPWGYGGIFGSQENFEDLWRIPLYTKDLLDAGIPNNALVPVLTGPTSTNQLEPTTYEMWMRPCYPLTDSPMLTAGISGVNMPTYYIDPQAHSPGGDPISFEATWDQGGQGHIRAQVVSDSPLGRNLRNNFHESRLDVWVEPAGPGPQTGSSPGVCVPSCPPIEITSSEILNQPYRGDLSAARLELCDRFGWNLDVDDYPPNLIPLFGYTIEYFHTTSSINPLHAEEHYFGEYISNYASLQEFCLVNNVHQRGFRLDNVWDLYRWQVKKACVTLDPDVDREISPGSMAATVCFLPDRGPFVILRPIVLQAQWIAGTNDIYLTWNDDSTRSTNDNDFTLFRREDDGAFQEIASGIEDLQYLDEELTPGTYTYRILSHGETYDSNTVEILGPNFEMNWQVIERAPTLLIVRHSNPYPGTEVSWRHEYRVNGGVWRGATSFTSQVIRQSLPRNLGDLQVQFRAARSSSGPSYDWHNSPVYTVENFDFGLGVTCHDAVYTATWNPSLAVDLWENGEVYGWISGVTPPFSGRLTTSARPTFRLRLHDDPSVESNRVSLDGCEWRPPAPAVTASSNLSTHVRLEWTSLPTGWPPSEWRIFRSDSPSVDPDNGAARIADVGTDVRTYDDYGAPTDQVLYYWVQAVVGSREGWPGQASGYRPEIYSSTLPDLTPRLRWIDPSGSHGILVQHEVENQGTAAVSGYSLRVALSTDPILSADDYRGEIETQDLPLLAFETRHVYSSLSVPQSYRNRPIWVFVEVDPHDSIEEADELNNTSPLFPPIVVFDLPF